MTTIAPIQRTSADPSTIRWNPGAHDSQATRVFLVDDHEIVRRGVRELLEGEDGLTVDPGAGEVGTFAPSAAPSRSARWHLVYEAKEGAARLRG